MRRCRAAVERLTRTARSAATGAAIAALALGGAPSTTAAADCGYDQGCIDVARLPAGGGADMAEILKTAQKFYGTKATAYIVSSEESKAKLPYMLPRQEPYVMAHQIHIPEIYHAKTEIGQRGKKHFVWHYIIGHEMAHVYQEERGLIEAMSGPFKNNSVVLAELHADYMAGFFMARQYRIDAVTIDNLMKELGELPVGVKGSSSYHGEPYQRFFVATQGVLAALRSPTPTLAEASSMGIECAFDLMLTQKTSQKTLDCSAGGRR